MPPRQWRRDDETERKQKTHPLQEYINTEWNNAAGQIAPGPNNYRKINQTLKDQWETLRPSRKRKYVYYLEKRLPLAPDRYNSPFTEAGYLYPTPEEVIDYQINKYAGQGPHPLSNGWIKRRRAKFATLPPDEQASRQRELGKIMRSRGQQLPVLPVPRVHANNQMLDFRTGAPLPTFLERHYHRQNLPVPDEGEQWVFHRVLYHSVWNNRLPRPGVHLHLYRKVDGHGTTRGVMVVKKDWKQHSTNEEGRVHEALCQRTRANVVNLYSWAFEQDSTAVDGFPHPFHPNTGVPIVRHAMSLYLEWLPHQNLNTFVGYYKHAREYIPEPFIWYCFRAMTKVCLESARHNPEIANIDLKLSNVALGHPDPTDNYQWSRIYPRPKVIDFGMAYETGPTRPPDFYWGRGTPGMQPPELLSRTPNHLAIFNAQFHLFPDPATTLARLNSLLPPTLPSGAPNPAAQIRTWTTVWQIGMSIWQMMSLSRDPPASLDYAAADPAALEDAEHDLPPRNGLRPRYSGRLVELVYQCLAFMPEERIGVRELSREVRAACRDVSKVWRETRVKAREGLALQHPVAGVPIHAPDQGTVGVPGFVAVGVVGDKYPVAGAVLADYNVP